ncbi:site-specific recombinase XerD [Nonomuraea fuscirosea]|uniref:Site-specific recombinase XerD n=1 Tax=Nonomuraea fuscirosea TaxID=1291556 RepID=A0A2T0LNQ1_9ACTN|nr:tyrosine-type recombinase/integrase [Nonomuraea fuscirosea]PRX44880.1 site-specific recombinase XerD [Nonomuraea fuscirosea]
MTAIDIQFWKIRKREGRKKPWELRWRINANPYSLSFLTKVLAQKFQSQLTRAAETVGEEWDLRTGQPVSWTRQQRTWFDHSCDVASAEWDGSAANSRKRLADSLAEITMAMLDDSLRARRTRPSDAVLRKALKHWAYRPGRIASEIVPDDIAAALAWLGDHSRPVAELADDEHLRVLLAAIKKLRNGKQAAATTARTRRAILYKCLDRAVTAKLITINPLPAIKTRRRFIDDAVSPVVVPTLEQARRLLWAVRELRGHGQHRDRGPHLFALFCLMFYAGVRPSEGLHLKVQHCHLPMGGRWGSITLDGACPDVGELWTDDGDRHDERGLKHRSTKTVRVVPIPPDLVVLLRGHLLTFPPAPDGRLFYDGPDRDKVPSLVYRSVWKRARKAALSPAEFASDVARRPYDLRHANASMLIAAGVDTAEIARRLGHSIRTLLGTYAHWIKGGEDAANALIEAALSVETITSEALTSENAIHGPLTGQPGQHGAA